MEGCIFCTIASGALGTTFRFENERIVAFDDVHPKAPVHVLIIPRQHVPRLHDCDTAKHTALIGELLMTARQVAADAGLGETGYRIVINSGADSGMEVDHLHVHVIGGKRLGGMA
ncbi:MAG: HIT domain-containing protein [Candidatus Uhrbacteria bacterium]